eukprot:1153607-Pelagomonas_calceolata.AAC.1
MTALSVDAFASKMLVSRWRDAGSFKSRVLNNGLNQYSCWQVLSVQALSSGVACRGGQHPPIRLTRPVRIITEAI